MPRVEIVVGSWRATKGLGGDPAPYVVVHEVTGRSPMLGALGWLLCSAFGRLAAMAVGEQRASVRVNSPAVTRVRRIGRAY
jgi:hypothetical protein